VKKDPTSHEAINSATGKGLDGPARPSAVLQLLFGASAVIGGLAYVIVRIALNHFYSAFGVTPEEVGWNVTAGLTSFGLPIIVLTLGTIFLVVRVQEKKLLRTGSIYSLFGTGWSVLSLPLAVIIGCAILVFFAHSRVNGLRRGVEPDASNGSMMPIAAPCVKVFWFDLPDTHALPSDVTAQHNLFLLGEAGGRTVLYDATAKATLRVPSNRVILRSCRE